MNGIHPFQSILVRWFLECQCSLLPSPVWPLPISRFLCSIALYSIRLYFHYQSHPQLGVVFALAPSLHSFWSYFSTDLQQHIGHLLTWGVPLSVSFHFAFSYCSWGSQGKNTEVVCHSLLQWTIFCQTSPPWPTHLGWPHGHGLVSLRGHQRADTLKPLSQKTSQSNHTRTTALSNYSHIAG